MNWSRDMSGIPNETKAVNFVLLFYIFIYIIQINDKIVMLGRLSHEILRESEESFRSSDDYDHVDDDNDDDDDDDGDDGGGGDDVDDDADDADNADDINGVGEKKFI